MDPATTRSHDNNGAGSHVNHTREGSSGGVPSEILVQLVQGMMHTQQHIIDDLDALRIEVVIPRRDVVCAIMHLSFIIVEEIKKAQLTDPDMHKYKKQVNLGLTADFKIHGDGSLRYLEQRLCVTSWEVSTSVEIRGHDLSVHPKGQIREAEAKADNTSGSASGCYRCSTS